MTYVIDPLDQFPKRWKDKNGPIRVMTQPVEGWVLARRPGAMPFAIHVSDLLGSTKHPNHGPFEPVGRRVGRAATDGETKP